MRYADEETEKLLKEAYANLPAKGISKKTRQKKRQLTRFKAIRKMRHVKKQERIAHHFATMGRRSAISKEVRAVIDGADEVRVGDLNYQKEVLKKWALVQGLVEGSKDDGSDNLSVGDGHKKQEI